MESQQDTNPLYGSGSSSHSQNRTSCFNSADDDASQTPSVMARSTSTSTFVDFQSPFNQHILQGLLQRAASSSTAGNTFRSSTTSRGSQNSRTKLMMKVDAKLEILAVLHTEEDLKRWRAGHPCGTFTAEGEGAASKPETGLQLGHDKGLLQIGSSFVRLGPKTEWDAVFVDCPQVEVEATAIGLPDAS